MFVRIVAKGIGTNAQLVYKIFTRVADYTLLMSLFSRVYSRTYSPLVGYIAGGSVKYTARSITNCSTNSRVYSSKPHSATVGLTMGTPTHLEERS